MPVGLVLGTTFGAAIELVVIRRLFDAPRVIVLVATIGVAQLSLAILNGFPDISATVMRSAVDGGGAEAYAQAHIRGAVHSDYDKAGWRVSRNGVLQLPNKAELDQTIGSGVSRCPSCCSWNRPGSVSRSLSHSRW